MIASLGTNFRSFKKNTKIKIDRIKKQPLPISSAISNGAHQG
jgi:hypothetical protein